MKKGITEKQRRFADEYLSNGCNATRAAISAGYSKKYAAQNTSKLLKNTNVAAYIKERNDAISSAKIVTQQELQEYWSKMVRGQMKEEVLIGVGKGKQAIVSMKASKKDELKASELLGRTMMMFTDRQEIKIEPVQFVDDVPEDDDDG
jgi:phage terminase small subunit